MARTTKTGLDYFPFDVDFFEDEKLQFLSAKFGIKGEIVAIKLLCRIYRNGYFINWGTDESILFAKRAGEGITHSLICDIVEELIERKFFDKGMLLSQGILTSRGIQVRYEEATKRRKGTLIPMEHRIIPINVDKKGINDDINLFNDDINSQSKVKESKVNKSESKVQEPPTLALVKEYFLEIKKPPDLAQKFYDHYLMNNWKTKNGEVITDWKAAIRNWCHKEIEFEKKSNGNNGVNTPEYNKKNNEWKDNLKKAEDEIKKHGKFKGFKNDENEETEPLPV